MVAGTIPIKTPEGHDELSTRKRRVSQRHRTVLFLIDGKRSAAEVRSLGLKAGVPEACFDELLAMGLVMLPEPTFSLLIDTPEPAVDVLHVDLPLGGSGAEAVPDSLLPASRTLSPESVSADLALVETAPADSWLASDLDGPDAHDPAFVEARIILLRAVRAEAPLAGSLTLRRLRRARNRGELLPLLAEVEARISKPPRSFAASQTMLRVRQLLDGRIDSSLAPA